MSLSSSICNDSQQNEDGSSSPSDHEYPDPDTAAYVTSYPWLTRNEASPINLQHDSSDAASSSGSSGALLEENGVHARKGLQDDGDMDSDYLNSDIALSQDENMSDGSFDGEAADCEDETGNARLPHRLLSLNLTSHGREADIGSTGEILGSSRRKRASKGRRGGKRGFRKPLEPGVEFKAHFSKATMAFTKRNFDEAELFTLKALQFNPEMFEAHNLLSEIHAGRGDKEKALSAAWNGAHLRPRDAQMWMRIASLILERDSQDRQTVLRDALYCYTRVLSVDRHNIEARYQRAALNRELGYERKAIGEYEYMLKYLPCDMTVLRHLAEVYIELNAADKALHHYEDTIGRIESTPGASMSLSWSDINIVAELYITSQQFMEGLSRLKYLSRWMLGRKDDLCWENFASDDREWDYANEPRRATTVGFVEGQFTTRQYGDGLPLELRIKFGICRLFSEEHGLTEAMQHFDWLEPSLAGPEAKVFNYPDLFREVAYALSEQNCYREALLFYEPLRNVEGYVDSTYLMNTASCYRSVGERAAAEECYKAILDLDISFTEARIALWNMEKEYKEQSNKARGCVIPVQKQVPRGQKATMAIKRRNTLHPLMPKSLPGSGKALSTSFSTYRGTNHRPSEQRAEVQALYARWRTAHAGDLVVSERNSWLEASKLLLQTFRDEKVFYPSDRSTRFYGYSKEARVIANLSKSDQSALKSKSRSNIVTLDGEEMTIPDTYMDISFSEWLNIFLETSLEQAGEGHLKSAYGNVESALRANVFYHSHDALFLIHVCWFTCALLNEDDETLCNVARWFMTRYHFVTDGYRLFAALNRLCNSKHRLFNSGPPQKYILRQIKAMDFSIGLKGPRRSLHRLTTAGDDNDMPSQANALDVALLMLYGYILYAGRSYAYAINYFLRALAIDSQNATIKFSLAMSYVHWAFKRQAENRHHIVMQGLAFLKEYYDSRRETNDFSQQQEAEFNVGRAYHLLGMTHLAIPHYEKCLQLGKFDNLEQTDDEGEDFSQEAALALQTHWAANSHWARAHTVTRTWLVM